MKRFTTSLLLFFECKSLTFSQNSNLVFYTSKGELFYIELNVDRQNDIPASFVRINNYNEKDWKIVKDQISL